MPCRYHPPVTLVYGQGFESYCAHGCMSVSFYVLCCPVYVDTCYDAARSTETSITKVLRRVQNILSQSSRDTHRVCQYVTHVSLLTFPSVLFSDRCNTVTSHFPCPSRHEVIIYSRGIQFVSSFRQNCRFVSYFISLTAFATEIYKVYTKEHNKIK
jgi:hypothetical protein